MPTDEKSIVLGPEYDEALRQAVRSVLVELGATIVRSDWGIAGSQEVEILDAVIEDSHIRIEAETYIGITLTGPGQRVEQIAHMVKTRNIKS